MQFMELQLQGQIEIAEGHFVDITFLDMDYYRAVMTERRDTQNRMLGVELRMLYARKFLQTNFVPLDDHLRVISAAVNNRAGYW